MHAHTHTHKNHTHARTHTHTHTKHTCMHLYARTHTHTNHMHARTHTHTHTHTKHTSMHLCAHTHTHTHTHTHHIHVRTYTHTHRAKILQSTFFRTKQCTQLLLKGQALTSALWGTSSCRWCWWTLSDILSGVAATLCPPSQSDAPAKHKTVCLTPVEWG